MNVDIIPIGNSEGIRIPKALLEQCGFDKIADISLKKNCLILSPSGKLRSGWGEAFKAMAAEEDDTLRPSPANSFDQDEWQW